MSPYCLIQVVAIIAMLSGSAAIDPEAYRKFNEIVQYDYYIKKYTKRFFGPAFDWRYFKAQAVAESGLRHDAISSSGAVGVMQILPNTFDAVKQKNPEIKGRLIHVRWNIAGGVYYNRTLWNLWKAERPFQDRVGFMFGSYNAGKGNVLKAQKIAANRGLNPNLWRSITLTLKDVTGRRSRETVYYVEKIKLIKEVLH